MVREAGIRKGSKGTEGTFSPFTVVFVAEVTVALEDEVGGSTTNSSSSSSALKDLLSTEKVSFIFDIFS